MLWAGRHQDGHRESWAPSAGGVVLAPCVFALSCPASGFSPLAAVEKRERLDWLGCQDLALIFYRVGVGMIWGNHGPNGFDFEETL